MLEEEPRQLYADVHVGGHVLTARLVGPSFGEREGPVVTNMIAAKLADAATPIKYVVLDLADVEFINSSGLGSCVTMHNQAKAKKAVLVIHALRKDLLPVFKMTRMDKLFKMAEDAKRLSKIIAK